MSKQVQGFQVGLDEREVRLTASQNGKEFVLKHYLRQPTEKDWLGYDRYSISTQGRGRKTTVKARILEARIKLYDQLVIRVEGYVDVRGEITKPLTPDSHDWKSQIPVLHKSTVIDSFGDVDESDEEGEEKN